MKKIVVDIDGVVLDFSAAFVEWYNTKFKVRIENNEYPLLQKNPYNYNFDHDETYPSEFFDHIQEFIDTKPQLELIHDNMPELLQEFNKYYEIHIISSYPHLESRISNLQKYNIRYNSIKCNIHNKIPLIEELKPEFVIEDHPELIKQLSKNNIKCFVPNWNYTNNLNVLPNVSLYNNCDELYKLFEIHTNIKT